MKKEFLEFFQATESEVPRNLETSLLAKIRNSLSITSFDVLKKYIPIHIFTGLLTLWVCPQFGVAPWGGSDFAMMLFMPLGKAGCSFFCGGVFFGLSTIATLVLLNRDELSLLRKKRYLFLPGIIALSLAAFMVFQGPDVIQDYAHIFFWSLGALVISNSLLRLNSLWNTNP